MNDRTDMADALGEIVDDLAGTETTEDGTEAVIGPHDPSDPELIDLLERARGVLRPPLDPLARDAPVFGDHTFNPDMSTWTGKPPRHAAVLIALGTSESGELSVVLTERAAHLSSHAGQVALPGGKIEAGETPSMAATREAEEEVALLRQAVRPIGLCDPYLTRTGFLVVPVLALVDERTVLRPHPGEVAEAFVAPWTRLMDSAHRRELTATYQGRPRRFYETMVGEKRVWGVTAGIFKLVSERLYGS